MWRLLQSLQLLPVQYHQWLLKMKNECGWEWRFLTNNLPNMSALKNLQHQLVYWCQKTVLISRITFYTYSRRWSPSLKTAASLIMKSPCYCQCSWSELFNLKNFVVLYMHFCQMGDLNQTQSGEKLWHLVSTVSTTSIRQSTSDFIREISSSQTCRNDIDIV